MHIQMLLKFGLHQNDPTGALIRACGELLRLELGIRGQLFQISHYFYPCITITWLSQCWLFCVQRSIEIATDLPDFLPQRQNDRELMQIFWNADFRADELATLNRCRMFLHVIFLSDICNGAGSAIDNQYWTGEKPADYYHFQWPQVHKLMRRDWELWQRGLSQGLNLGQQGKLALPLGKWTSQMNSMNRWFTDISGDQLYHLQNDHWTTYSPIPLCRRTQVFHLQAHPIDRNEVPRPLNRAMVYAHGQAITLTGHGPIDFQANQTGNRPEQLFWELWKCEESLEGQVEALCDDILHGTVVAVSDGSFQLGNGAAAWTIEGSTASNRIQGAG